MKMRCPHCDETFEDWEAEELDFDDEDDEDDENDSVTIPMRLRRSVQMQVDAMLRTVDGVQRKTVREAVADFYGAHRLEIEQAGSLHLIRSYGRTVGTGRDEYAVWTDALHHAAELLALQKVA